MRNDRKRGAEGRTQGLRRRLSPATLVIHGILFLSVGFHAWTLAPEVWYGRYLFNDGVLHLSVAQRMVQTLETGEDPLDHWLPNYALGFPFVSHYQMFGHLLLLLLDRLLAGTLPLWFLFAIVRYLLLSLFPVMLFLGARCFGLPGITAAFIAAIGPLLSDHGHYGIAYESYIWRGSGLYTQLVAMNLFPVTLGAIARCVRQGKGRLSTAALLLGLLYLSHVIYGYMASLSVLFLLFPFEGGRGWWKTFRRRAFRLEMIFLLAIALIGWFIFPMLADSPYLNHSRWEPVYKWDGYGAGYVWRHLWGGSFFDHGRAPVLTLLAGLGFLLSLFRGENRFFAVNFLFWGLLLCGRPTWGSAIDLLPAGRDLHLHRVIGAFQFHGVFLAGIFLGTLSERGVAWFSRSRLGRRSGWGVAAALIPLLFLLPLLPLWRERVRFYAENERWGAWNDGRVREEAADLEALFRWLRVHPWGRIYPGLAARWGGSFKVGYLPLYAFLGVEGFDAVAFLYHAMSLNSDLMVHFDEWNPAHYDLMNVRYVVSEGGRPFPPFVREVARFGRFHLYRASASSGYFGVVRVGMTFRCDKRGLYDLAYPWMQSGHLARRNFPLVLLEGTDAAKHTSAVSPVLEPGDPLPPVPEASPPGRVIWERAGPPRWEAEVEMAEDAYILFKMTAHPKWQVEIDGTPVATVMLGPSFVGVPAPAGRHRVTARYTGRPERWLWLGVGILLWLWAARRERRGRSRTRPTPSRNGAAGGRGA